MHSVLWTSLLLKAVFRPLDHTYFHMLWKVSNKLACCHWFYS